MLQDICVEKICDIIQCKPVLQTNFFSPMSVVIRDDVFAGQNMLHLLCIDNVELNNCIMTDIFIIPSSIKKVHLDVDM
jgi:hypothetical protein